MFKKLFFIVLLATTFACNDGNVEVPSFDFNTTVNACTNNSNTVLFRLGNNNSLEALILTLATSDFPTEATSTPVSIAISASKSVIYRLFNTGVSANYFCQSIPPITPAITRNWQSNNGTINITTTVINDAQGKPNKLSHAISFNNLVLESNGETLQYNTLEFGTYVVNIPTS